MPLPIQSTVELPLLKVIEESGGQLRTFEAIKKVTSYYKVYFQAKRWKNQVPAKEVRDFIGSIQTSRGDHGIFVTTSEFSSDALETAEKSSKIRLINGTEFAKLMIEYGLGVSKNQLDLPKIDNDYFEGL